MPTAGANVAWLKPPASRTATLPCSSSGGCLRRASSVWMPWRARSASAPRTRSRARAASARAISASAVSAQAVLPVLELVLERAQVPVLELVLERAQAPLALRLARAREALSLRLQLAIFNLALSLNLASALLGPSQHRVREVGPRRLYRPAWERSQGLVLEPLPTAASEAPPTCSGRSSGCAPL